MKAYYLSFMSWTLTWLRLSSCRTEWYRGPFCYLEVFPKSQEAMASDTSYGIKTRATHAAIMLPKDLWCLFDYSLETSSSEIRPMEQVLKT
jgi:hypothetical protein